MYNLWVLLLEGDKLANRKLSFDWAGPYIYEKMKNDIMNRVGKVDESGQVVRRFLVQGSKLRLCQLMQEGEKEQYRLDVRPGLLLDFPDRLG